MINVAKVCVSALIIVVTVALCSSGASAADDASRPNLLVIYADQMRGDAMGWVEDGLPVRTPNLDRLANEGVAFTEAVSNYPVCSPWRASFLTGRYYFGHDVLGNAARGRPDNELRRSAVTWSDVLDETGYSLGYIGKWHLDSTKAGHIPPGNKWNVWTPPDRRHGFDFWYAYGSYNHHDWPMYWRGDAPRDGFHYVDQWEPREDADQAIRFIRNEAGSVRDPDQPWGLVVAMNPPHRPYRRVPGKYKQMYAEAPMRDLAADPAVPPANTKWGRYYRFHIRNHLAMVTGVDRQVGRILDALRRQNMAKNTLVVFTSDHGDCLGMHNQQAKSNPYEAAMHVPLIVRFPGRLEAGKEDLLISTPDLYPTMLGLMEMAERIPDRVSGTDFASLLTGGSGERPVSQLYLEIPDNHPAFGERGVRTARYTLAIRQQPEKPAEVRLWDRRRDPHMLNNVADEHPEVVNRLIRDQLTPWLKRTDDPWLKTLRSRIRRPSDGSGD